jgi:tetratricopeptide (TPR) repeat protein
MSSEAIEALLAEASRLYNEGDYRTAIQKWQEVLGLDPNNQKARESIKIASLLSDTWAEVATDPTPGGPSPGAAGGQEHDSLAEGMTRIRDKLAARDFRAALQECEALAALSPSSEEIKSLTDQARSGIESEPFIRAALERAEKELKTGHFEMVEVLCRKVLSLDAANRQARTYLYMAQRRTAGQTDVPPAGEVDSAAPPPAHDSPAAAPEAAPAEEGVAPDPLAGLVDEIGSDLSPLDLAGGEAVSASPAPDAKAGLEPAVAPAPGSMPISAFERGEEIDASQLESIPLGAPRPTPTTRSAADLIQDGSVYTGPDPDALEGEAAPRARRAAAPAPPAPLPAEESGLPLPDLGSDLGDPAAPAAERRPGSRTPQSLAGAASPAPGRPAKADKTTTATIPARSLPAARAGGSSWLKAAAVLLLLVGGIAGAAIWWLNRSTVRATEPSVPPLKPMKPAVASVSGPPEGSPAAAHPQDAAQAPSPPAGSQAPGGETPGAQPAPAAASAGAQPPGVQAAQPAAPAIPSDPAARQAWAQKQYAEARRRFGEGNLREAKTLLAGVLEADPMLFEAKDLMEKVDERLLERRKFEEDVQTVRRSFEASDFHSALWKLYRLQEAYPEVPGWDRNIAAAWYNWGVTLLKAANCREAIEKFNEVLAVIPQDREAVRLRAVAERYLQRDKDAAYYSYVDGLNLRPLEPIGK